MIHGSLIYVSTKTRGSVPNIVMSWGEDSFTWTEVLPETVGQCTDFKDINGNYIFEGDICEMEGYFNVEVEWSTICHEWSICGGWLSGDTMDMYKEKLKIIGNIHQNKELLEQ